MKTQAYYTKIMSGYSVSTPALQVAGAPYLGVFIPTVTSGAMYAQGGWGETSTFGRIVVDDGVVTNIVPNIGSFWPVGSGCLVTTRFRGHNFIKFESGVAQADTRTLVVTVPY